MTRKPWLLGGPSTYRTTSCWFWQNPALMESDGSSIGASRTACAAPDAKEQARARASQRESTWAATVQGMLSRKAAHDQDMRTVMAKLAAFRAKWAASRAHRTGQAPGPPESPARESPTLPEPGTFPTHVQREEATQHLQHVVKLHAELRDAMATKAPEAKDRASVHSKGRDLQRLPGTRRRHRSTRRPTSTQTRTPRPTTRCSQWRET